jgi:hypothetical protein
MLHHLFHPCFFQPAVLTLTENHQFSGKDQPGNQPDPELDSITHLEKLREQTEKDQSAFREKNEQLLGFFLIAANFQESEYRAI